MNPASPYRATARIRNAAVAGLGVLALISLAVAIVVANMVADTPSAEAARTRAKTQANPSLVARASDSPSPQASTAASPVAAGGGQAEQQNQQNTTSGGGTEQHQGPSIVYFRFRQWPSCKNGEPLPAIVEWKVTGAESVALSVDNPGVVGSYGTYHGSTGEQTLHVSCGGGPGSSEEHVYTIYTVGGGERKSATLNATVKVPAASPAPKPSPSTPSEH